MTHWPNSLRATALGQPQEGKRRHLVLCLSRAMNSYMGSASDLCECKSLTSALLSFGAKNTFKGNRACSSSTLRASAPATWEETRYLDRVVISKEQRGSPASHSVQALDPLRQTALPIKVIVVSTPREKCGHIIHIKTSLHNKDTGYTQSTWGYSHIKTPFQDHNR